MEIKLDNLQTDAFDVREGSDEENYDILKESLKKDGQWDPIIVRPSSNGTDGYQVIAGHTRCKAARDLGWDTIEATVKDVDDEAADELSLKTNLVRSDMSKIEQGKVLNHMQRKYEITQSELANRLGKSVGWVKSRQSVAMDLHEKVQRMLEGGDLSFTVAGVLSDVDKSEQVGLAEKLFQKQVSSRSAAIEIKQRHFNDTIYTIGYQGREWDEFVDLLHENDIEVLVDIRRSAQSQYKPDFSKDRMGAELHEEGIEYRHIPELGVVYEIREPYTSGYIDDSAFRGWYAWSVTENEEYDVDGLATELEGIGPAALMCMEAHAEPIDGEQDHHCHRDFLAEKFQHVDRDDAAIFPNREDL